MPAPPILPSVITLLSKLPNSLIFVLLLTCRPPRMKKALGSARDAVGHLSNVAKQHVKKASAHVAGIGGGRRTHKRRKKAHKRTHHKKRKHKKSHKKKHRKKRRKTHKRR